MVGASARPRLFSLRSRSRSPGLARLVLAWRSSIRRRIAVLSPSHLKVSSTPGVAWVKTSATTPLPATLVCRRLPYCSVKRNNMWVISFPKQTVPATHPMVTSKADTATRSPCAAEQRQQESDAERLGSLEVGDHHCLLNGQVSRLCKFKSLEFRNRTVTHAVMIGKSDFEQSSNRI